MKDVVQQQIETWIQTNSQNKTICTYGEGWQRLTRAEEEVFLISIEEWPRLLAYFMAFEVLTDDYHHDLDRATRATFKEYRLSQHWTDEGAPDFIQFARAVGLDTREAMALHWKQTFGLVRSGDITFKDETMIQTVKKGLNKLLHFPIRKTEIR